MSRDVVERLRRKGELAVTPGLGYGTIVSIRGAELLALVAVVEAAQEYRDDIKRPRKRDPVTRTVTLDFSTQQRLATKLDEALERLHSQASDEGKG